MVNCGASRARLRAGGGGNTSARSRAIRPRFASFRGTWIVQRRRLRDTVAMHVFQSALGAALWLMATTVAQATEWPDYGGTPDQSKYAVTPDITKKTVSQLDVAWIYPTGDERAYLFNPIIVDGVMYVLAKNSSLIAIDVATRKELWIHANLRGIT